MRHHENLTRLGRTRDDETMFFQGVIRVRKSIREWISKNRLSFLERDAVLNKITRGFLLVPCKKHGGTIAALSLSLPLKDYIRPTVTEKNFMRAGFAFDVPSNAEEGSEYAFCFG